MKCLACDNEMKAFFVRKFNGDCGLGDVEYEKCPVCGTVRSKCHDSLSDQDFGELCRTAFQKYDRNQPGHKSHARRVAANCTTLIATKDDTWLDYGCGDALVAGFVRQKGHRVLCYDPYQNAALDIEAHDYQVMLAVDVIEHLRDRQAINHFIASAKRADTLFVETPTAFQWQAKQGGQFVPAHCLLMTVVGLELVLYRAGFARDLKEARLWVKQPRP